MSRSGSYNFTVDRDTLIKRAMQNINIINTNQTARGADQEFAVYTLQTLVKFMQARGMQLWNRKQATLFPAYQDYQYSISSSGDHCANSYVDTTLSAAEASGQTVLSVTSSTGMTAADYIGIELDSGARQWTTIVSVDSSTQITVTTALTGAAASGNTIVTYTNKIADRPLRILDMRTIDLENDKNSISMENIGYDQYFNIPAKVTDGRPLNYYYDKMLDSGVLYVFPRPNNVNELLEFTYHEAMEDVDSSTDNFDIPSEWILPLQDQLEYRLAIFKGKMEMIPILKAKADESLEVAESFDSDEEPLFILPDISKCR